MEEKVINNIVQVEDSFLSINNLNVFFGKNQAVREVSLEVPDKSVIAIMGPSGCGKSTMIRAINRMHEFTEGARVEGAITLRGEDIMAMNSILVRTKIGMVFQKPNPFPTMSIYDNVIAGYILTGKKLLRGEKDVIVEEALSKAFLWDEVKDRLFERGTFLSGGQQQRLCIARSLAMKVEMLLLDEPTSALDPIATLRVEELIGKLREEIPIMIVTHNTSQASRISNYTAFMYFGELVEYNKTKTMFTIPNDPRTEEYLTGKFG